jgi:hypothetical protein
MTKMTVARALDTLVSWASQYANLRPMDGVMAPTGAMRDQLREAVNAVQTGKPAPMFLRIEVSSASFDEPYVCQVRATLRTVRAIAKLAHACAFTGDGEVKIGPAEDATVTEGEFIEWVCTDISG